MTNKNLIYETFNIKALAVLVTGLFIEAEILKLKKTPMNQKELAPSSKNEKCQSEKCQYMWPYFRGSKCF